MRGNTWTILKGNLRDARNGIIGWIIGTSMVAVVYLTAYPLIGTKDMTEMLELMPKGMLEVAGITDVSSAAGYANATIYTLLGLAIALIFAITTGARLIGGEEERGVLELQYTSPASRSQTYIGAFAELWIQSALVVIGLSVTVSAANALGNQGMDYGKIWMAGVGLLLITGAFGTITFAIGAATGRRTVALGIGTGFAVICYLANAISPVTQLEWMANVSPFHWYSGQPLLLNGPDWAGFALLALLSAVPGVLGWVGMRQRGLMA